MIYRIPDSSGDASYDFFVADPQNRPNAVAKALISLAVDTAKANEPEDYTWSEVLAILIPQGFEDAFIVNVPTEF